MSNFIKAAAEKPSRLNAPVWKPLTSFHLKIIALTCMIIDHIGATVLDGPSFSILRWIGRIAFPLYAFMIAEGCRYTRSREKYLLRLGLFALVSELPFDLAFWYNPKAINTSVDGYIAPTISFFDQTNVFFTLFFGVACIHIYEILRVQKGKFRLIGFGSVVPYTAIALLVYFTFFPGKLYPAMCLFVGFLVFLLLVCAYLTRQNAKNPEDTMSEKPGVLSNILALLFGAIPAISLASAFNTDYADFGIYMIVLIYLAKKRPLQVAVMAVCVFYEHVLMHGFGSVFMRLKFGLQDGFRISMSPDVWMNLLFGMLSVVLVCFYNDRRGNDAKWVFYWAYPVHIAILAALKLILIYAGV